MADKAKLVKNGNELADALAPDSDDQTTLMEGLSDRQRVIVRFKMRGLSQAATAQFLKITPARVSQEMKAIRAHYVVRGSNVNQAALVGDTLTLFEEIEQKGWEVYHADESKRLRALDTIMSAREKQLKLLMDLGHVKRAAVEHTHGVVVSPILSDLTHEVKQQLVATIIETAPGKAPSPPMELEEDFYESPPEDVD